jgi:hypothetical protein
MPEQNVLIKISWANIFVGLKFVFFQMFPTTLTLTDDKLAARYLGLVKFHEILIKDMLQCEIMEKKWIGRGIPNIYLRRTLMIKYKKNNRVTEDYLIASSDKLSQLLESLTPRLAKIGS